MDFQLPIRALSGQSIVVDVQPEMSIAELASRLMKYAPEFHSVKLLSGFKEIKEGTLADAGIAKDLELQVVFYVNLDEVISSIAEYFNKLSRPLRALELDKDTHVLLDARRKSCVAVELLGSQDEVEPCHEELLLGVIDSFAFHSKFRSSALAIEFLNKGHLVQEFNALAEALGRSCCNPRDVAWHLLHMPNIVHSQSVVHMDALLIGCVMSALREIDSRHPQALFDTHRHYSRNIRIDPMLDMSMEVVADRFVRGMQEIQNDMPPMAPIVLSMSSMAKNYDLVGKFGTEATWQLLHSDVESRRARDAAVSGVASAHQCLWTSAEDSALAAMVKRFAAAEAIPPSAFVATEETEHLDASGPSSQTEISEVELSRHHALQTAESQEAIHTDAALDEALQLSDQDAALKEQADLHEALMKSKADAQNSDGVVVLRLDSRETVKSHLLHSTHLEQCVDRVVSAGCKVSPLWANGALLFVPMTQEQLIEAGIELKSHNIVLLEKDEALVKEALRQLPKRGGRPALKAEYYAGRRSPHVTPAGHSGNVKSDPVPTGSVADIPAPAESWSVNFEPDIEFIVERTFIHFPLRGLQLSESSTFVQSAPADVARSNVPANPRRWM